MSPRRVRAAPQQPQLGAAASHAVSAAPVARRPGAPSADHAGCFRPGGVSSRAAPAPPVGLDNLPHLQRSAPSAWSVSLLSLG